MIFREARKTSSHPIRIWRNHEAHTPVQDYVQSGARHLSAFILMLDMAVYAWPSINSSHRLRLPSLIHIDLRRLLGVPLRLLPPFLRHPPDIRPPFKDILRLLQDILPILEQGKRHALPLTKCHQIMPLLRKQQIRLPRRTQIAHSIPRIQQRRLLAPRHPRHRLGIRSDGQTLIMPEAAVVVILYRPPPLLIQIIDGRFPRRHVSHNLNLPSFLLTQQMLQQGADDGHHPRRQHDDGNPVLHRPLVEARKVRVERDVGAENGDAFREGQSPALQHRAEGVAEADLAVQRVEVALAPPRDAEAVRVG